MAVTNVQFAVAAHIMTVLGFQYDTEITSSSLADSVNAEPTFVRKSLSKLAKAGLVKTTRGKSGSCVLARPPAEITLCDIYRASEAPNAFSLHAYPIEQTCGISANIKACMSVVQAEVQRSLEQALAQTTLAELVTDIRDRINEHNACLLAADGTDGSNVPS